MPEQRQLERSPIAQLYRNNGAKLFDYARKHVSSYEDAEDILVEVFVAALENAEMPRWSEAEQRAWLWRVARNKIVDLYRRSGRMSSISLSALNEEVFEFESVSPEQKSVREEEQGYLWSVIQRLPPLQQRILELRFADNMRCAQIALKVKKREGAVRAMLSRTLNQLRSYYEQ